jgi:uncharacterized membrane protein YjjP (DUF1212 family)
MTATPDPVAPDKDPVRVAGAIHVCLLLGRMLFHFGATTQRIQDSIACLAHYLGCKVEMLVSYDALLLTVNDGSSYRTRIESSRGVAGLNLLGLTRVSKLLRGLPQSQTNSNEIQQALCAIRDAPPLHKVTGQVVAAGCAGAAFCIVNGGDPASWVCSFVAGAFIFTIRRPLAAWNFNVHLTLFAVAVAGSFLSGLIARIMHAATPDVALVAPLLFLVPGVPIINGGIDVVRNHVTIGIARVGFAVAAVLALCLAASLTVRVLPVRLSPPFSLPGAWGGVLFSFAGALAAGALAWLNNGDYALVALCALGGLTGRVVHALLTLSGLGVIAASLIAALCGTWVVSFAAERLRWPAVVASVIAALPMVPGYSAIAGLHVILSFAGRDTADPAELSVGLQALARAFFISIALVVGVIAPLVILQRQTKRV